VEGILSNPPCPAKLRSVVESNVDDSDRNLHWQNFTYFQKKFIKKLTGPQKCNNCMEESGQADGCCSTIPYTLYGVVK
jgi:hypothetical protein